MFEKEVDFFNQLKSANTNYDFVDMIERNHKIIDEDNNGNSALCCFGKTFSLAMLLCEKGTNIDKANIFGNNSY